jgi:O-methyltransferase
MERRIMTDYSVRHDENILIFGAEAAGRAVYEDIRHLTDRITFTDVIAKKWGHDFCGRPVISPVQIPQLSFDRIIVATIAGAFEVPKLLAVMGVPSEKIVRPAKSQLPILARIDFLERLAVIMEEKKLKGNIAEAGVYRGEFSREMNRVFPQRSLYLFDTFEGFDEKDFDFEINMPMHGNVDEVSRDFSRTSVNSVLSHMPHPEKCIVKKGVFPESAQDVRDEFCFVCLDMDLYKPMSDGLKFFYPRMVQGGVILVHDYYCSIYTNVKRAVEEFAEETGCSYLPIGDATSVVIQKDRF